MLLPLLSCFSQEQNDDFFNQVVKLKEVKLVEAKIDSLKKKTGLPFEISIDILHTPLTKQDSVNGIATAFINEELKLDHRIIYSVKYNRIEKRIILVKKENKGF